MSTPALNIAIAQINLLVGDMTCNAKRVIEMTQQAAQQAADIIVFPELTLSGYPPEDLLLRPALHLRVQQALTEILQQTAQLEIAIVLGMPAQQDKTCFNRALWLQQGKITAHYDKQKLPNYGVFDEQRYFTAGKQSCVVEYKGYSIALLICEDLWHPEPMAQAVAAGAQLVLSLNASPFDIHKSQQRRQHVNHLAAQHHCPILYVNLVGGQDQLLFDGGSFAVGAAATAGSQPVWQAPFYTEQLAYLQFSANGWQALNTTDSTSQLEPYTEPSVEARIYQALVLATRDYLQKNRFPGALLGLSGGIDSALALAITVDAIGPEAVSAIMMPSEFTRQMSLDDAQQLAENLAVDYQVIPIQAVYEQFLTTLSPYLAAYPATSSAHDTTPENIQARCRGTMLMALSNRSGRMVIACGNKSEMAVGYATLYGDMAGGFAMLKDIPKTMVYRLARYRNQQQPVIPERIIERPPSAELSAEQVDQDSLPAYDELDDILERYIELDQSPQQIVAAGHLPSVVEKVIAMVNRNEYKRRQAAPGVCITRRAFDKERRYPITSGYFRQPAAVATLQHNDADNSGKSNHTLDDK